MPGHHCQNLEDPQSLFRTYLVLHLSLYSGILQRTRLPSISEMSSKSASGYHLQCSGKAAETAAAHQDKDASIQAYFACFCPFVQRAWIALEHMGAGVTPDETRAAGFDYRYVEVDPYKKPQELLEISPKGLVP